MVIGSVGDGGGKPGMKVTKLSMGGELIEIAFDELKPSVQKEMEEFKNSGKKSDWGTKCQKSRQ